MTIDNLPRARGDLAMSSAQELLHKIFLGEVASVQNYGAFVRIPGSKLQGLVHRSQVSKTDVADVSDVLSKGDRVWCKAINLTDDGKISLSMKVVDQGNGSDLDPAGVQVHQDALKRQSRAFGGGRQKIELEAVLNTQCSKCGTKGHLSKDCFQDPSGKKYELLPDEDDDVPLSAEVAQVIIKKKKSKKDKKEKKSKKKKKKRHMSSSSSSSSSSDDSSRRKKKKKKRSRSRSPRRKGKR